jgi:ribosomal protein S18 acetylase RimI-like enzyme
VPTVRRLLAGEWREWRALRLAALRESPESFASSYEREAALSDEEWGLRTSLLATAPDRAMFVAELDDRLIGCAGVFADADAARTSWLIAMWVAPEHRNQGVGQALVDAALARSRSRGDDVLRLLVIAGNDPAQALYRRAGFAETGRTVPLPRDASIAEIEMEMEMLTKP